MEKKDSTTFLCQNIIKLDSKNKFKKPHKKKTQMSLLKSILNLMIYASGSKFLRFGPATRPTRPKRTKEPIPKPAAQGLKPPKAKEANKFMILKHNIFE